MQLPCNSLYYDYVSDCAQYDSVTSTSTTTTTSTTTSTTQLTTTTSTTTSPTNTTFPDPIDFGDDNIWLWLGPLLGFTVAIGIGVVVKNRLALAIARSIGLWIGEQVIDLIDHLNSLLEGSLRGDPEGGPATPPPGYDDIVSVNSDRPYESHDLDSHQDSWPLRSISGESIQEVPPTPPAGRYLTDRIIYRGSVSGSVDREVSAMINRMFASNGSDVSSERDLSSPDPERRVSSMIGDTQAVPVDMDISSINTEGTFEDAVSEVNEEPPRRNPTRSTRNPEPKYH